MDESTTTIQTINNPINVYRVKPDEHIIGWIILCVGLTIALIIFILLWAFSINDQYNTTTSVCFGPYGVETGVDANALNQCGTTRTDPCIFAKSTIADCEAQCETLKSICNAFTFNSTTTTMKIVHPTNTFISPSSNLFVRQSGIIS
jgi:hypothetical protein